MDLGLDRRTVIVTGASGGIGRYIARTFADEGAHVVLTYNSSAHEAEQLAKEIGERALVMPYALDDEGAAQRLVDATTDWTGRIDVLINNAVRWGGQAPTPGAPFEAAPDSDWTASLRANIDGTVRLTRAVVPIMRTQQWGRLVHISSSIAVDGMSGAEYYATAKAAMHGLSRSLAFNLGSDGDILSNVVMPGLTRTETNQHIITAELDQHFASLTPIGRLLEASEVAGPVVYLGSAANTGVTGQVIAVTGGA